MKKIIKGLLFKIESIENNIFFKLIEGFNFKFKPNYFHKKLKGIFLLKLNFNQMSILVYLSKDICQVTFSQGNTRFVGLFCYISLSWEPTSCISLGQYIKKKSFELNRNFLKTRLFEKNHICENFNMSTNRRIFGNE